MVVDCMSSVYTYLFAIGIVSRTGIKYLVIPKWLKKKVIKDCVVIKKIFLVFPDSIYINMIKVESFKCICICLVLNLLLFVQCLLVHRSHWLLQDSKQGSEIPFFSWFHLFFFLILSSHFIFSIFFSAYICHFVQILCCFSLFFCLWPLTPQSKEYGMMQRKIYSLNTCGYNIT